jgi:hypothetical protein
VAEWAARGIRTFRIGQVRVFVNHTRTGQWRWRVIDFNRGEALRQGFEEAEIAAIERGRVVARRLDAVLARARWC